MIMMRVAKVPEDKYRLNALIAMVAMVYSTYAIYASGKDAVLGGMLMTAVGYIIWGFIAPRFTTPAPAAVQRTGKV
jgi:putrescine:ornithine antiporter